MPQIEWKVLSKIFHGYESIEESSIFFKPLDFSNDDCRKIFTAMLNVDAKGKPVDLATVASELKMTGQLEIIGGPQTLVGIANLYGRNPDRDDFPYPVSFITDWSD